GQNTLEQCGFTRAQETSEYGDGYHFIQVVSAFHRNASLRNRCAKKNSTCDYITACVLAQTYVSKVLMCPAIGADRTQFGLVAGQLEAGVGHFMGKLAAE